MARYQGCVGVSEKFLVFQSTEGEFSKRVNFFSGRILEIFRV